MFNFFTYLKDKGFTEEKHPKFPLAYVRGNETIILDRGYVTKRPIRQIIIHPVMSDIPQTEEQAYYFINHSIALSNFVDYDIVKKASGIPKEFTNGKE
jgi:hypothetical protein